MYMRAILMACHITARRVQRLELRHPTIMIFGMRGTSACLFRWCSEQLVMNVRVQAVLGVQCVVQCLRCGALHTCWTRPFRGISNRHMSAFLHTLPLQRHVSASAAPVISVLRLSLVTSRSTMYGITDTAPMQDKRSFAPSDHRHSPRRKRPSLALPCLEAVSAPDSHTKRTCCDRWYQLACLFLAHPGFPCATREHSCRAGR